jgi:hypothetical protein
LELKGGIIRVERDAKTAVLQSAWLETKLDVQEPSIVRRETDITGYP